MESTWIATAKSQKKYPSLAEDLTTEVAIIGGGLAGVTAAYLLAKAGKEVVLITQDDSRESASANTTAFITTPIDTSLQDLTKMYDAERAKLVWQSGRDALDHIEKTVNQEGIDCEFMRCPYYYYATDEGEFKDLEKEAKLAREYGFAATTEPVELPFPNAGAMTLPHEAKFHALKYLDQLKSKAVSYGAKVFDRTRALGVLKQGDREVVNTPKGTITAHTVLLATYYPFTDPAELYAHTGRYITYLFEAKIPKGLWPEAMYEDSKNPYHYMRIDRQETFDRLIVGGEDHRREIKIDPRKNYAALRKYLESLIPKEKVKIVRKWRWGIIETIDGLPYIGPLKDARQYVITGLSGTGMTLSRIAAEMFVDYVLGKENPYAALYEPLRLPKPRALAKKGADYMGELIGGAGKNVFKK
jgi:glycine/D-amino acid oxidase-like deaminating enzyme